MRPFTRFPREEQREWHAFDQTAIAMKTDSDFGKDNMTLLIARHFTLKLNYEKRVATEIRDNIAISNL
jgi:hypothetical protein